nr:hypothetical protein [Tanacetum cinerariifolium]
MSSFNQCECLGCGQPCDGLYCYLCTCQQYGVSLTNGICLNFTYRDGKPLIYCECEGPLRGGFCWFCDSRAETSFAYDPNPNSFDDSQNLFDYPPQTQCVTHLCELCGNDSHYGYDCPPRFPLVYEQEPSYNQNYNDNYYPHNSLSFLCCDNCGGPHESFQCQTMNQNYFEPNFCYDSNSFGFDQPSQYTIDHQEDLNLQSMNDVDDRWNKIIETGNKIIQILGEMVIQREQAANLSTQTPEPSRRFNYICYDEDDDYDYKENEFIKSSVEDLVPILSESKDTFGSKSVCILSSCNDFSPIDVSKEKSVTFSNPLFNSNDDFTSSGDKSLSDEDVSEDNVKIYSNPLFEFDGEYISSDVNPLFDGVLENIESKDSYDSNLDEPDLLVIPLSDANKDECFDSGGDVDEINDFKDGYYDSEGYILYLESLLNDDTTPNLHPEVFLDRDLRSLSDAPIDNLMFEDKIFDLGICVKFFSPTYVSLPFTDRHYLFFTYVVQILLLNITYPVVSHFLISSGSEDTIFDPGISLFIFLIGVELS